MASVPEGPGGPNGDGLSFEDLVGRLEQLAHQYSLRTVLRGLREVSDLKAQTLAVIYQDATGAELWGRAAEVIGQLADAMPEGL
jgi:hypothetical protein